ncbi:MAG: M23 family metallopeptidase [Candidatus Nealsonbacteria bacterium]|nr:M23 family metallopeptidase [Candidatus Nealsonbacteria bacterium]
MHKGLGKKVSIVLFVLLLLGIAQAVLAIEISYPQIPGVEAPQDFLPKIQSGQYPGEQALPLFVKYLYALGLVASTVLTVISLIYGGVLYILSGSNPGKMIGAKDQITTAFLGLGLLLLSYLFLNILNPDLLVMKLPSVSRPVFSPPPDTPPPGEAVLVFWELPLGTIFNDISNIFPQVKPASQDVKDKADIAKQASQELVDLLNSCQCQNLSPQCSSLTCSALACLGTRNNLCPNLSVIEAKKQDLMNKLGILKVSRKNLAIIKFNLQKETSRLQVAETLMKSCTYVPIDLNTMLGLKQTSRVEIKKPWSETDAKNNPLSFYCQMDEAFVTQTIFDWREMIAQLESILNTDPDDIPLPPPSPGPLPTGTPGPGPSPVPGFSFNLPLSWTCLTDICNVRRSVYYCHEGLDLYAAENSPIYAVADGEIAGSGDFTADCPPGGAYGRWVAVKHQVGTQEMTSFYGHLNSVLVTSGRVAQGQIIAYSGNTGSSTGPHLHFSLTVNFAPGCLNRGTPLDPQKWLPAIGWCSGFSGTPDCSICQ